MAPGTDEKRRFPRIPAQHALLVKKLAEQSSESLARTEVMGGGGCMFVHDELLGEGARIQLLISVRGAVVKATARVAWERPREDGRYEVGVEFTDVSHEDRGIIDSLLDGD